MVRRPWRPAGSLWENRVTRVIPLTAVPFSAYLAAPYIQVPTFMMVGRNDEMVHCNPDVTRATYDLMRCPKLWVDIDGGHFGLLYYPSEIFKQASRSNASSWSARYAASRCPLWVISGQTIPGQNPLLSAMVRKRTFAGTAERPPYG